jgi:hypothetical protein
MTKIQELKAYLKGIADDIRVRNFDLKTSQRANLAEASTLMWRLHTVRRDCRNHHIAYCELRGRTRDQIERPRKDNKVDETTVSAIKAKYTEPVAAEAGV